MLLTFINSWQEIPFDEKIYWYFAVPCTFLLILQVILMFVGGEGISAEFDDVDGGIEFQFLSVKSLTAFGAVAGWVGVSGSRSGLPTVVIVIISLVCGLFMMGAMAFLMYNMHKLSENGSYNIRNTIGKTGTVYLTIPESQAGVGKLQINSQGVHTLDAMTEANEPLPTGSLAIVVDVVNDDVLLVSPTEQYN